MVATKKTDNDFLGDKILLRADNLPCAQNEHELHVLDCFGGRGIVWAGVERKTGKKIRRTAIDKRDDLIDFHMHGDNVSVMRGLDLSVYDVIDLDAYGVPIDQLEAIFASGFKGRVFVTMIQTMTGAIPKKMLIDLGFPGEITKKAPSLPARKGWALMKEWLALKGVKKITHRSKNRKHYFFFNVNDAVPCAEHSHTFQANKVVNHA